MVTLTSQDRRPPNIDPGLEIQPPQAERVREPDRETLRDFRDHLQAKGVSRKTLQTYLDADEAFAAFCADHGMPDLENATREHIEAWQRDMRQRGAVCARR